jgi:hypothetical protein
MTTSLPHTHVRLRDLSELVAGIPYIVGFPPTDSLVLFTFRRYPLLGLSATIRVDLPKPEHVPLVVADVVAAVSRNKAVAAIAVVVGDPQPEHRQLVESLRMSLADNDILLTHASWVRKVVHGEQWQCYDDPLCTSEVPDPETSALAAAVAVAGDTTYPNREAVAAHLSPDPEEALARRRELLKAHRADPVRPYGEPDVEEDLATLGHALDKAMTSYELPTLNDHQLVRLARALTRPEIKDACLAMVLTDEPEPAERLWTVLVRSLPAPERAEPAFLLAISAYLRGAGVLAALTLRIAMESNPKHALAIALDHALQSGLPPESLRDMLTKSVINNHEERTSSSPPDDDPPWDTTPEQPDETPEHPVSARPSPTTEVISAEAESHLAPDATSPAAEADTPAHDDSVHSPHRFVRLPTSTVQVADRDASAASTTALSVDQETPTGVASSPESVADVAPATSTVDEQACRNPEEVRPPASIATVQTAIRGTWAVGAWPPGPAVVTSRTSAADTTAQRDSEEASTTVPSSKAPAFDRQTPAASGKSPEPPTGATSPTSADEAAHGGPAQPLTDSPRTAPGALSQRAAATLSTPIRDTAVMDALTAFLPPLTDRSEPG